MPTYDFKQVDVFTDRPFLGNPVAVVLGADGLATEQMQAIARWTNLSETTFMCRPTVPEADYLLRIFTPSSELPFAGHPTVGSAHAVLDAGIVREFVMECGAGLLPLRVEGDGGERRIFVQAPQAEIVHDFTTSVEALSAALGAPVSKDPPPVSVGNGPVWLFCRMESEDAIAGLKPDMTEVARLSRDFAISGPAPFAFTDGETAVKIRCFAPASGITEDPVTGSANAALPAYLARFGLLGRTGREYVSSQGRELRRDGRVHVRVLDDEGRAEIGGQAVTVVDGKITV
jgi:PhzF family phenazine biosynthesis protein